MSGSIPMLANDERWAISDLELRQQQYGEFSHNNGGDGEGTPLANEFIQPHY